MTTQQYIYKFQNLIYIIVLYVKKKFMLKAIEIAKKSSKMCEYPIGAIIVKNDEIISTGTVRRVVDGDPTSHAEIVAIREACKKLNSRSLKGCILYSTQECCPMCSSAAIWANVGGIVFGAFSEDTKCNESEKFTWRQINISCKEVLNNSSPKIELVEGFMRDECIKLIILS